MSSSPLLLCLALGLATSCTVPNRDSKSRTGDGRTISLVDGAATSEPFRPMLPPVTEAGWPIPPPKKDRGTPPSPDLGGGLNLGAQEKDLLDAINAARTKAGLKPVSPDPILMCAARLAAKVVPPTGSCGHVGTDGSWPNDRAASCGMNQQAAWKVNEIAAGPGFTDGADAVWGWSQSSGHWAAVVHPQATKIGVAATASGCYWAVFDCCIAGS